MEKDQPSVVMPNVSSSEDDAAEESYVSEEGRDSTLERAENTDRAGNITDSSTPAQLQKKKEVKLSDGSIYTGEWMGDIRHGHGKLVFPDGGVYRGQWQNDKPHGSGTRTYPDGSKYTGQYVDGLQHGYGEFSHSGIGLYIGQWKNDLKHGED